MTFIFFYSKNYFHDSRHINVYDSYTPVHTAYEIWIKRLCPRIGIISSAAIMSSFTENKTEKNALLIVPITVDQISACSKLHETVLIYFDAKWSYQSVLFRNKLGLCEFDDSILFHCALDANTLDAEDYVIEVPTN